MKQKYPVILKVIKSAHGNHRLGLFEDDHEKFVKNQDIKCLKTDLDDLCVIDFTKSMAAYVDEGTLAQHGRISTWIENNGYLDDNVLLLFELTVDDSTKEHFYRFIADANKVYDRISQIKK